MPARLIINADDFGLTPGINRAIVELHWAGAVSSATLMATGAAFDDAVDQALASPSLGVGCHIVLVDGSPVSAGARIETLLGADGQHFRPTLATFVRDLVLGRIDPAEVEVEACAQIEMLQARGISITHLDTHKHTHIFPQVARAVRNLANLAGIPVRNPFEPAFSRVASPVGLLRGLQLSALEGFHPNFNRITAETATTDGTLGIAATGTMDTGTLRSILTQLPGDGTWELCCHPGYNDRDLDGIKTRLRASRGIERQALLSVVPERLSLPNAPQLIHYGDLRKHP